jgi:hypothetical protein
MASSQGDDLALVVDPLGFIQRVARVGGDQVLQVLANAVDDDDCRTTASALGM